MDSFGARDTLDVDGTSYEIFRLDAVPGSSNLPYTHKVLLENLLRTEDGANVTAEQIERLGKWDETAEPRDEIQFTPARVIMQDFTGVPCVVDLATMREAVRDLGGDPEKINPLAPAELVIDHSVIADFSAGRIRWPERRPRVRTQPGALPVPALGSNGFRRVQVVPPAPDRPHQVNIESLARVVMVRDGKAYPDTCVGTDSHHDGQWPPCASGWGVGGIEAEAAMLGQPVSMLVPRVVGSSPWATSPGRPPPIWSRLSPSLLRARSRRQVRRILRRGCGSCFARQSGHHRQYESGVRLDCSDLPDRRRRLPTCGMTGRSESDIALVEAHEAQGLWHRADHEPRYSEYLELDLGTVQPSLAGPKRPQDRVLLAEAAAKFAEGATDLLRGYWAHGYLTLDGEEVTIGNGAVVIAAITSCTNTSNPSVMMAAGLLAKKAVERGLTSKPWVKTTLALGPKVVTDHYEKSGLDVYPDKLRVSTWSATAAPPVSATAARCDRRSARP